MPTVYEAAGRFQGLVVLPASMPQPLDARVTLERTFIVRC